ncbi:MAG TPA: FAD-dependent oxidoreductase, partial [Actinomycetes bacterium]|nr:FAD-dependent oxidoreductase [Actinomycetes bacterium]
MNDQAEADPDVLIVGGGIGGLSNALGLARAGHRVRVLESAPEFSEIGAGLQLAPNANRILRDWGLLDEVAAAGFRPRRLVLKDAIDGGELTHLPIDDAFEARYGTPYYVIHRSDLLDILVRACKQAGVELRTGAHVEDVSTEPDGATVTVASGPAQRAAVVLAADGLWSTLRRRFSDDEPVCSGFAAYRGAVPMEEMADRLDELSVEDMVVYFGPGCHFVQYPLRGGTMFNQVAVFRSPSFARGEAEWGGPEELDDAFAPCCHAVRHGLDKLWRDRHWPMFDRVPITHWVDGRVALTGDAAHPMLQYLAQGACQAIEDAGVFSSYADPAGAWPGSWEGALSSYAADRVARAGRVQTLAR